MDKDNVVEGLLRKLRQLAPHRVRVYDGDDHRDVAVPTRRRRWAQVIETVEGRPWTRCELLDKSGSVLGYVDNVEIVEEDALDAPGGNGAKWIVDLVLRAQQQALHWRAKEHSDLLSGMRDLLEVNTHATRELVELFRVQRDVASDVATMRAAAAGGDMGDIIKLVEASPQLMQALGPLFALLTGPKAKPRIAAPPPPPNGAKS